ncbi:hypothetical protein conserved [Leishmania donovani]|uniref:Hypothetical_protein_conserved n=1 Tax=Leishmania donovani TaxID=5661 RepID=A0A3Q8ICI7_LEIDO|nr:hypothetical protein, conserved [Leishmania donovani]AYU79477.1 hypothetical protein LdCL_250019800 [Leishmania donovani]TPP40753.1 hypothetical protein CGC21_8755 [Leishmania donovani]TPP48893.1 hypothetical protein CGC20_26560 [Leishmania donovani]CAJ1989467.1 hypothetical protein conserved [Leishmania donovani]CBZ34772.1 hypothetical protein, conserved [Leishmania donovani]
MRATRWWCCAGVLGGLCARTLPRLQHFTALNSLNESVAELRRKLQSQLHQKMPRMQTVETESRLIAQLSRSTLAEERAEALEMGEAMWVELHDAGSSIPFGSRTAMKITLCSSLRRCALVSKNRELAETWTARFAERAATLSPADFKEQTSTAGKVPGWREARTQARPGTGIDADDLEADAREEAEAAAKEGDAGQRGRKKEPSPFEQYRQEKMLEHPTVELAFRRRAGPGPRYTG